MKLVGTAISLALFGLLPACSSMHSMAPELANGVTYTVEFTPMWTAQSHPIDYPQAGVLTGPHFSGMIGASHGANFTLFAEGRMPTPGLERLSEMGKHSPQDEEIRVAIAAGNAGDLFEGDAIKDLTKSATTTLEVSAKFPLVSLVAMIAPSPDWFAGAADVNLRDGNQWLATKEVTLWTYDSGGDAGTTYTADDIDLDPKQPTRLNDAAPFMKNGQRMAVGHVTFRRQ